jgi:hypothetical protein
VLIKKLIKLMISIKMSLLLHTILGNPADAMEQPGTSSDLTSEQLSTDNLFPFIQDCKLKKLSLFELHSPFLILVDADLLAVLQDAEKEIIIPKSLCYIKTNEEYQESETVWKKRMEGKEKEFKEQRHFLSQKILEQSCSASMFSCTCCRSPSVVRCATCRQHFCSKCDLDKHRILFTHQRTFLHTDSLRILGPSEFVDHTGAITTISIKRLHCNRTKQFYFQELGLLPCWIIVDQYLPILKLPVLVE